MRWLVVVSVFALLLGGCGDDDDGPAASDQVDAQVYAAVVSWFADDHPPPEEGELVAVYLDGLVEEVPIEAQVEVLALLDDEVDVRFIDDDEEAVDEDLDGSPVRKEGLLLRLGPVIERDGRREVDVERYEGEGDASRYRFVLGSSGDTWRVIDEPEELPVPEPEG